MRGVLPKMVSTAASLARQAAAGGSRTITHDMSEANNSAPNPAQTTRRSRA